MGCPGLKSSYREKGVLKVALQKNTKFEGIWQPTGPFATLVKALKDAIKTNTEWAKQFQFWYINPTCELCHATLILIIVDKS